MITPTPTTTESPTVSVDQALGIAKAAGANEEQLKGVTDAYSKPVIQTTSQARANTQMDMQKFDALSGRISNNTGVPNTNGTTGANGVNTPNDGSKTTKDATGKETEQEADPNDPFLSIKSGISSIKDWGEKQISDTMSTLRSAMGVADANANATINNLMSMYAERVEGIKDSYKRLGAKQQQSNFREGLARYSPLQGEGILTDIEVQGQIKISNLLVKLHDSITKAQEARDTNNLKAFREYYKEVDSTQKEMNKEVSNLYKAAVNYKNAQTKEIQAKNREASDKINLDVKTAAATAPYLAVEVAKLTPDQRKKFIESHAMETGLDAGILAGEVEKASQTKAKTDAQIRKANAPGKVTPPKPIVSGGLTVSPADIGNIEKAFSTGGTLDGIQYNGRGTDGYMDPGFYSAWAKNWTDKGGLIQDFVKTFPPDKHINPEDNKLLPEYLQHVVKTKKTDSKNASIID